MRRAADPTRHITIARKGATILRASMNVTQWFCFDKKILSKIAAKHFHSIPVQFYISMTKKVDLQRLSEKDSAVTRPQNR